MAFVFLWLLLKSSGSFIIVAWYSYILFCILFCIIPSYSFRQHFAKFSFVQSLYYTFTMHGHFLSGPASVVSREFCLCRWLDWFHFCFSIRECCVLGERTRNVSRHDRSPMCIPIRRTYRRIHSLIFFYTLTHRMSHHF